MRFLCWFGLHRKRPLRSFQMPDETTLWTLGCDRCGKQRQHITNTYGRIIQVLPWT
jgi:transposase